MYREGNATSKIKVLITWPFYIYKFYKSTDNSNKYKNDTFDPTKEQIINKAKVEREKSYDPNCKELDAHLCLKINSHLIEPFLWMPDTLIFHFQMGLTE